LYRYGNVLGVIAFCAIFGSYFGRAEAPFEPEYAPAATAVTPDPKEFVSAIVSANDGLYGQLQSFVCSERIERFAARKKSDSGRRLDTLNAEVSFENGHEHYSKVKRQDQQLASLSSVAGAWSEGEFGTLLRQTETLLRSEDVRFEGEGEMSGAPVSRLYFDVSEKDSPWDLEVAARHYRVPFRAHVWVDKSSGQILKIARKSLGTVGDTRIAGLEWTVTLAPVELNGKNWLLPKQGEYSVEYANSGRREWNELSFSNYHRYGSEVSLRFDGQD
jgi:hypothetical protein